MASHADRRKTAYRKKLQNRTSMILIMTIVVIVLLVVCIKGYGLMQQRDALQTEYAANEEEIQDLEAEKMEIEEYKKYKQTPQYFEEMAREKLGMVRENETRFVPEE